MSNFVIFLGGYRQEYIKDINNVFKQLLINLKPDDLIINLYKGNGDSLEDRWSRLKNKQLNKCLNKKHQITILSYSMGCHLVAKCSQFLSEKKIDIQRVHLIAPDPKLLETELDVEEKEAKKNSAFIESCKLWQDLHDQHNQEIIDILKNLEDKVYIYYNKKDEIAEWSNNVEKMVEYLKNAKKQNIEVKPENARTENWIHENMFIETINFIYTKGLYK